MNAAFELVRPSPAAGALLLVRPRRPGARDAADRTVSDVVQRVVGDVVRGDVVPHGTLVPARERMHLPDAVALRVLQLRRSGPRRRLASPDSRDPSVVRLERADERLHLADVATAVAVALPEVRPFLLVLLGD